MAGLTSHEAYCGSRTAPCDMCGSAVPLKRMELHKRAHETGIVPMQLERAQAIARADAASAAAATAAAEAAARGDTDMAGGILAAGGWACPACTLANDAANTVCSACRTAAPPGLDGKPYEPPPSAAPHAHPLDQVHGASGAPAPAVYECPSCTFANEPDASQCAVCGAKREATGGGRRVGGDAGAAGVPAGAARRSCANAVCSGRPSSKGEAKELGLCSRCYGVIVQPHDSEKAVTTAILKRCVALRRGRNGAAVGSHGASPLNGAHAGDAGTCCK